MTAVLGNVDVHWELRTSSRERHHTLLGKEVEHEQFFDGSVMQLVVVEFCSLELSPGDRSVISPTACSKLPAECLRLGEVEQLVRCLVSGSFHSASLYALGYDDTASGVLGRWHLRSQCARHTGGS